MFSRVLINFWHDWLFLFTRNRSSCDALQIENINQAFKLKEMEAADYQKRISNTRRIIGDLRTELAKVEEQPDVTPRINEVNVELRHNQMERAKIDGEKSDLRREKDNAFAQCKSETCIQTKHCPEWVDKQLTVTVAQSYRLLKIKVTSPRDC